MRKPTKFEINGLFGDRDVSLPIENDALILVGPNGIGKSSVTNIFYFFVSRQWERLAEYEFSEVAIWFGDDEVRAARSDITGLSQFDRVTRDISPTSRISYYIEKLRAEDLLEQFITSKRSGPQFREKVADVLSVPAEEIRHLQFSLKRRFSSLSEDEIFLAPRINIGSQLAQKLPGRALYLPTYRRIEKDLKEILPDLEDRLRSSARPGSSLTFTRSAKHYVDLVSFGMEDVSPQP